MSASLLGSGAPSVPIPRPGQLPSTAGDIIGAAAEEVRLNRLVGSEYTAQERAMKDLGVVEKYREITGDNRDVFTIGHPSGVTIQTEMERLDKLRETREDLQSLPSWDDIQRRAAEIAKESQQELAAAKTFTSSDWPTLMAMVGSSGAYMTDPTYLSLGAVTPQMAGGKLVQAMALEAAYGGATEAGIQATSVYPWQQKVGAGYTADDAVNEVAFTAIGSGLFLGMLGVAGAGGKLVTGGPEAAAAYIRNLQQTNRLSPGALHNAHVYAYQWHMPGSSPYAARAASAKKWDAWTQGPGSGAAVGPANPWPNQIFGGTKARGIDVTPVDSEFSPYRQFGASPQVAEAAKTFNSSSVTMGGGRRGGTVATASGARFDFEWEVVEGKSLIHSKMEGFLPELQPRHRSKASMEAQVRDAAAKLDPERLAFAPEVNSGAPIVGPDMMVESGNGRTLAILRAAEKHPEKYAAYRKYIAELTDGDGADMELPILIRRRTTPLSDADRVRFTQEGNDPVNAAFDAQELSAIAASRLNDDLLDLYKGGSIDSRKNADFVRALMESVPVNDRNRYTSSKGRLTPEGATFINHILVNKAFGGTPVSDQLLERMMVSGDANTRSITGALINTAGEYAQFRTMVRRSGWDDLDTAPQLVSAIEKTSQLRKSKTKLSEYIRQQDVFDPPDPDEIAWMKAFYDDETGRAHSQLAIEKAIRGYIEEATAKGSASKDLLSNVPPKVVGEPDELIPGSGPAKTADAEGSVPEGGPGPVSGRAEGLPEKPAAPAAKAEAKPTAPIESKPKAPPTSRPPASEATNRWYHDRDWSINAIKDERVILYTNKKDPEKVEWINQLTDLVRPRGLSHVGTFDALNDILDFNGIDKVIVGTLKERKTKARKRIRAVVQEELDTIRKEIWAKQATKLLDEMVQKNVPMTRRIYTELENNGLEELAIERGLKPTAPDPVHQDIIMRFKASLEGKEGVNPPTSKEMYEAAPSFWEAQTAGFATRGLDPENYASLKRMVSDGYQPRTVQQMAESGKIEATPIMDMNPIQFESHLKWVDDAGDDFKVELEGMTLGKKEYVEWAKELYAIGQALKTCSRG